MNRTWVRRGLLAATLVGSLAFASPGTAYADYGSPITRDNNSNNDNNGLLNGNQADAPVSIPINVCGNAVGLFGKANAECNNGGTSMVVPGTAGSHSNNNSNNDNNGALNGNQADAPVSIPINVCGNAVGLFGTANAACNGDKPEKPRPPHHKPVHKPSEHKPVHKPVHEPPKHKPHHPKCKHHREKPEGHHMKPVHMAKGVHEERPERLANTGADPKGLLPPALLMLTLGGALVALGRRRRPAKAA